MQNKSADLTKFNETVSTLKRVADADAVQELDEKQRDLNSRWNNLTINQQRQRTLQEKLATAWNKFNFDLAAADTQLAEYEEQAHRIDKTVRSKQQLTENGNQIQVRSNVCKALPKPGARRSRINSKKSNANHTINIIISDHSKFVLLYFCMYRTCSAT